MGRKHKFVNKTHYPDWAIERLTRSIYDDVLAFFATEEGQAEYEAWEREQAELKKKRAAAPKVVAAHSFIWFFWADRYGGMSAHRGRNKQIIRTLFQFGKSGSDYICLVHRKGLDTPMFRSVKLSRATLVRVAFNFSSPLEEIKIIRTLLLLR